MFSLFHLYMQTFESGKQGERADLTFNSGKINLNC